MIKILFVCHGNICRSPMAEFVMKDFIKNKSVNKGILIESAATSREEIGNDIHWGTKNILDRECISYTKRKARQMTKEDYKNFDYIIIMDEENKRGVSRIVQGDTSKVRKLMSFANLDKDVADPWYTGNFDVTFEDIKTGIQAFWNTELKRKLL